MAYDDAVGRNDIQQNLQRQTRDGAHGYGYGRNAFQRDDDRRGYGRDGGRGYDDRERWRDGRGRDGYGDSPRRLDDRDRRGYGYGYDDRDRRPCDRRDDRGRDRPRYEILEHVATIRESERYGHRLDVNVMAWNGGPEKIDVRTWRTDEHGDVYPAGGVTLTYDEVGVLMDTLARYIATPRGEWRPSRPSTPPSPTAPAAPQASGTDRDMVGNGERRADGETADGVPF